MQEVFSFFLIELELQLIDRFKIVKNVVNTTFDKKKLNIHKVFLGNCYEL